MKIFHIISSINIQQGGPSKSVCDLASEQAKHHCSVNLISFKTENAYFTQQTNLNIIFLDKNNVKSTLNELINHYTPDILHGHGLWLMIIHKMSSLARKRKIPYIISPRGMLEPWALQYKNWKKQLALFLYQRKDLELAHCIHATSTLEATHIRKLGFKNPIAVIPNPIEVKKDIMNIKTEKKRIAFMGRLHPIKNIENLIRAWSIVSHNNNWELLIIGEGEEGYVRYLRSLVSSLKLENILFLDFVSGEKKDKIMQTINLLVLPSHSENFGMVVGEALQYQIPVIASTGTPWEDLKIHNCGWWVNNDFNTLANTINEAISLPDKTLAEMGARGRQLIINKYSLEKIAQQTIILYNWLINGNEKPDFLFE